MGQSCCSLSHTSHTSPITLKLYKKKITAQRKSDDAKVEGIFIERLEDYNVSVFNYTAEDIKDELNKTFSRNLSILFQFPQILSISAFAVQISKLTELLMINKPHPISNFFNTTDFMTLTFFNYSNKFARIA